MPHVSAPLSLKLCLPRYGEFMKGLGLLIILFVISGCSSNNQKTTVTGERVKKSDFKKGELTELKPEKGESIFDMLVRMQGAENMPKVNDYEDCSGLLLLLKNKNITIESIQEKEVVAITPTNKKFTYNFKSGSCLG